MAAGMAHELNNPLTGVLTFAHLVRNELEDGSPQAEDLDLVRRGWHQTRERFLAWRRRRLGMRGMLLYVLAVPLALAGVVALGGGHLFQALAEGRRDSEPGLVEVVQRCIDALHGMRDAAADFGASCVVKLYLDLYDRLLSR